MLEEIQKSKFRICTKKPRQRPVREWKTRPPEGLYIIVKQKYKLLLVTNMRAKYITSKAIKKYKISQGAKRYIENIKANADFINDRTTIIKNAV